MDVPPGGAGGISSKWSAYSMAGVLAVKIRLGNGFTLEPALDLECRPARQSRKLLGCGHEPAAVARSPPLQLADQGIAGDAKPRARLESGDTGADTGSEDPRSSAWSWISSFGESDPVLKNYHGNEASIRSGRSTWRLGMQVRRTPASLGGFRRVHQLFGDNRNALGSTRSHRQA